VRLYGRRALLAGAALTLAATAAGGPACPRGSTQARDEVEQFLHLLAEEDAAPHLLRPALDSVTSALPEQVRQRLAVAAGQVCISEGDFLSYSLLEGLPFSARLLSHYVPRCLAFCVPGGPGQNGLLGAGMLPALLPPSWRPSSGHKGLGFGLRPGLYLGANPGLAVATLLDPGAEWLGPGIPPAAAGEYCLETARSPEAALKVLAELRPARSSRYLLCDPVAGGAMLVEVGLRPKVAPVEEPFMVVSSAGPSAEPNAERLRAGLAANVGWITADKGLNLLRAALPGGFYVVLDLDAREGLLEQDGNRQSVRL
jgi:hypothetical protein